MRVLEKLQRNDQTEPGQLVKGVHIQNVVRKKEHFLKQTGVSAHQILAELREIQTLEHQTAETPDCGQINLEIDGLQNVEFLGPDLMGGELELADVPDQLDHRDVARFRKFRRNEDADAPQ